MRERTIELEHANESLQAEVAERQQAEQERQRSLEQVDLARQRAENLAGELRLANNMLRTLIETLPIGMVITDPEGEIILANPLATTILGSALAIVKPDFLEILPLYHLDGTRLTLEELPFNRALMQKTATAGLEAFLIGKMAAVFFYGWPPVRYTTKQAVLSARSRSSRISPK